MQQEEPRAVILETTHDAVRLARTLIRTARSGAIATIGPDAGWPMATRVGVSTDIDGTPVILISRLAAHTGALLADPRCSLLIGYPGKGDPLAHPRITIACEAGEVSRDGEDHQRLNTRYLAHQQKAGLYAGLGDFRYFRLTPKSAALNAGFGRAFVLEVQDILNRNPVNAELAAMEPDAITHMNEDHAAAVTLYAQHFARAPAGNWRLIGIDAEGIDLADGDDFRRVWFDTELNTANELREVLVRMARDARTARDRSDHHRPIAT